MGNGDDYLDGGASYDHASRRQVTMFWYVARS